MNWKAIVAQQQKRHRDCVTQEMYFDKVTGMRSFWCAAHGEIVYYYPKRVVFVYEGLPGAVADFSETMTVEGQGGAY